MKPERLLPMILVIAGAAVFFSAYHHKTTLASVPPDLRREPAVVLFYKSGCIECHWVARLPDARGTLGPGLDNVGNRALKYDPEHNGKDYLRDSILYPSKVVREGFINAMPSFKEKLTEHEVDTLVDWLSSLREVKK